MESRKAFKLSACFMLVSAIAVAQATTDRFILDPQSMHYIAKQGIVAIHQSANNASVEGSPYLMENWTSGKIISDKDQELVIPVMNYNISDDNFEVKLNKDNQNEVKSLNPKHLKSLKIGEKEFIVIGEAYYEILVKGKHSLVKKYKAEIKEEQYVPGISAKQENPVWKISSKYFVMDSIKSIKQFSGRKDFLTAINKSDDKEADKMARRTDFKNELDLRTLFEWLNRL
jgi:hypothetical protein